MHLYECFVERDCSFIEINPLVVDKQNQMVAVGSQIKIDECAIYRQPELEAEVDRTQFTYSERIAENFDLTFQPAATSGDVGVLANGAGMVMACMDLIKHHGGSPAQFFDFGGPSGREQMEQGLRLIYSDPRIRTVFINVTCNFKRRDQIIDTLLNECELNPQAFKSKKTVLRLVGVSTDSYQERLEGFLDQLNLEIHNDWDEAVIRSVELAREIKETQNSKDSLEPSESSAEGSEDEQTKQFRAQLNNIFKDSAKL